MGAPMTLLLPSQWINEGQDHQFAAIPLYDEKGVLLPSVTNLWLTLFDEGAAADAVVNTLNHTSIKNTARYAFAAGQFRLTLNKDDLAVTDTPHGYTIRHALIDYSYGAGGAKAGSQLITFVIRHQARYPYVAP